MALVAVLANLLGWAFVDCRQARVDRDLEALSATAFVDAADICRHAAPDGGDTSDETACQHCLLSGCHHPGAILPAVAAEVIAAPLGHPLQSDGVVLTVSRLPLFAEARGPPSLSRTL